MSALTAALFVLSLCAFLALLATALYLLLVQQQAGSDSEMPTAAGAAEGSIVAAPVFSCEVEVVVLDEQLQITNMDECQVRLDGAGLGRGLRLVSEDQLQLTLQPGLNQYRLYSMGTAEDESEDKQFLLVRVAPDFVEIKPVLKYVKRRLEIIIWKLKPYTIRTESQLAERQVFCGYLQKTIHFARSPGKYFRFLVTTSGPQNRLASFVSQSNADTRTRKHKLLTLRVHPDRVSAVNQSSLPMRVTVRHRAETLRRRLSREMRDLPLNGTFSFSLLISSGSDGAQKPRKALQLHLSEKQLVVEPHSRFGSLPLSCDVYLPDGEGDCPALIVSGDFLSPLQLPRSTHRYVMSFFLHMKGSLEDSVRADQAAGTCPR